MLCKKEERGNIVNNQYIKQPSETEQSEVNISLMETKMQSYLYQCSEFFGNYYQQQHC